MPQSPSNIKRTAWVITELLNLNRRSKRKYEDAFEELFEYDITLKVVDDEEWLWLTKGHFDPSTLTISVPNSVYIDACLGDRDALHVMFHEMGHVFLLHKPVLHYSDSKPKEIEDSEWQADYFAEIILQKMGYDTKQLSLNFDA